MEDARELTNRLLDLLRNERSALADFVVALAELDRRRGWEELGYQSIFPFLQRELGLSDGTAYSRMKAAQLVREFPEVLEALRDGRLCVTNAGELSKVLTRENLHEVLPRYFHVSKRDAKAITVSIAPRAIVPTRTVVTAVRAPALASAMPSEPGRAPACGTGPLQPVEVERDAAPLPPDVPAQATMTAPPRRADVDPLTADLARLAVTVPRRVLAKLAAARDALSHLRPGATDAEVLEAGLDAVLAQAAKRRGATDRPRKSPRPSKDPGRPTAAVKRQVWTRDGGRCQWPVDGGGVCGATYQCELDHVRERALGGGAAVDDLRILCRPHNLLHARQTFGEEWMDRFARAKPAAVR